MEELLEELYSEAGGDEVFGSLDNFRNLSSVDPELYSEIYKESGGDEVFGNIDNYNKIVGVGAASAIPTQREGRPQVEIDIEDSRNWFQQFGDYVSGLHQQAREQGKQAEMLEIGDIAFGKGLEDLSKGELIRLTDSIKRQQEAAEKMQGFEGIFTGDSALNKIEGLAGDIGGAIYSSLVSQGTAATEEGDMLKAVGTGAATGLAVGALTGPGALATTITGAKVGAGLSFIAAGADVEFSSILMDRAYKYARENNLDPTDPDVLESIFSNQEWRDNAMKDASIGAAIVTGVDIITAGLASKFGGARMAKAISSNPAGATGIKLSDLGKAKLLESGIEGVGGSFGEFAKQTAIEDQYNTKEIFLEGAAGSVTGLVEQMAAAPLKDSQVRKAQEQKRRVSSNTQSRLQDQMVIGAVARKPVEEVSEGIDQGTVMGAINKEQADELKTQYQSVAEMKGKSDLGKEVSQGTQMLELHTKSEIKGLEAQIESEKVKLEAADDTIKPEIQSRIDALQDRIDKKKKFVMQTRDKDNTSTQDVVDTRRLQREVMSESGLELQMDDVLIQNGEVTLDKQATENNPELVEAVKKSIEGIDGLTYKTEEALVPETETTQEAEGSAQVGQEITQQQNKPEDVNTQTQIPDGDETPAGNIQTPQEPGTQRERVKTPEEITQEVETEIQGEQQRLQEIENELSNIFEEFQGNESLGELTEDQGGILRVIDSDQDVSTPKGRASSFKNLGQVSKKQKEIFGAERVERAQQLAKEYAGLQKNLTPQSKKTRIERAIKEGRAIPQAPQETIQAARETVRAANDTAKARYKVGPKKLSDQVNSVIDSATEAGITIEVLSDKEFTERRGKSSKGSYLPKERTVLINKDKASQNTLWHELAHALIVDELGVVSDKVTEFAESLRGAMGEGTAYERQLVKDVDKIIQDYENSGGVDTRSHEFLAELAALLTENKQRLQKRRSLSKRIIDAINTAIKAFTGKTPIEGVKSINEAIDFINGLADRLKDSNLEVENKAATAIQQNFDSLNRDPETRDQFIRDLQKQFPELTPQELQQVLNREGVNVTSKDIESALRAASPEVNLIQSMWGESVTTENLNRINKSMTGADLPPAGHLGLQEALEVAKDQGYITRDGSGEMAIATMAMNGEGINALQSLALGSYLARLGNEITNLQQQKQQFSGDTNVEIDKAIEEHLYKFRLASMAYAQIGTDQARGMVYRSLLEFTNMTSEAMTREQFDKEYGTNVPKERVDEYFKLIKEHDLAAAELANLVTKRDERSQKIRDQWAIEEFNAVKKDRKKAKPTSKKEELITNLRKSLGLDEDLVFDSTDPEGERRKMVELYRNIYKLSQYLITQEGVSSLPNLIKEVQKVAPTVTDLQVKQSFALANRRMNQPKRKSENQIKMNRIRREIKVVEAAEKIVTSLRGRDRIDLKEAGKFAKVLEDLRQIMFADKDSDSTSLPDATRKLQALARAEVLFSEGQKLRDEGLLNQAYNIIESNVLNKKSQDQVKLEAQRSKLLEDTLLRFVEKDSINQQDYLNLVQRLRDLSEVVFDGDSSIDNLIGLLNNAQTTLNEQTAGELSKLKSVVEGRIREILSNREKLQGGLYVLQLQDRLNTLKENSTQEIVDGKLTGVQIELDVEIQRQHDVITDLRNRMKLKEHEVKLEADLNKRFPLPEEAGAKRLYMQGRRAAIKTWEALKEGAWELPRATLFSGDFSMFFNQGGQMLAADIGGALTKIPRGDFKGAISDVSKYGTFIAQTLSSAWGDLRSTEETSSLDMYYAVLKSDSALLAQHYGVNFSKPGDISKTEEFFRSRIIQNNKLLGKPLRFFEHLFVTYMNFIRAESFKNMYQQYGANMTEAELKQLAEFVNDQTGKSSAQGKLSQFLINSQASHFLAAPSLLVSQYRMAITNPAKTVGGLAKGVSKGKLDLNTRAMASHYFKYMIGQAAITAAIAGMFGWEFEEDPKDRNFGKLRKGEDVIDLNHGLMASTKLAVNLARIVVKNNTGENLFGDPDVQEEKGMRQTFADLNMKFIRYKFHPSIQFAWNMADQANTIGVPFGTSATERYSRLIASSFLPIALQDLAVGNSKVIDRKVDELDTKYREILGPLTPAEKEGFLEQTAEVFESMIGVGVIDYDNRLDHYEVDTYLRSIKWKNKEGRERQGVDASTTATEARKNIPSIDKDEKLRSSANGKGMIHGYKKDCDDFLGQWILEQLQAGNRPTKNAIKQRSKIIQAQVGKVYEQTYFPKE